MTPNHVPSEPAGSGAIDRREFLGRAAALVAAGRAGPRLLAPRSPTLVCIYLRGGADALNVVVPFADKTYYEVRPTISIPAEPAADEPGVLKLDKRHGLHPSMGALERFWKSKQLAAILNVGSPHPTRSHFDAQDFMEYGAPGDRSVKDGWLNRFLRASKTRAQGEFVALAMQPLLPRSLRGEFPVLAVPQVRPKDSQGVIDVFDEVYEAESRPAGPMEGMRDGEERGREGAVAIGRNTIDTLRRFWDIAGTEPPVGGGVGYPKDAFAQRLKTLSRVIRRDVGLQVAALDLPGFDHHQGEGASDGALAPLLKILADGLGAFATDLGPALERTVVIVMTEFGRTVAENGNRGTDHGRGGMMLLLGGPVAGGRVLGSYGSLAAKELADGRDLRVDLDFRAVFTDVLSNLFEFAPPKGFFPNFTLRDRVGAVRKL
jgi:uncharacterized protein (DUF1501 family)